MADAEITIGNSACHVGRRGRGEGIPPRVGTEAETAWSEGDREPARDRRRRHQTRDIYHACEHIADAGKKLFGEGTADAMAFFEKGRTLLLAEGWKGVCDLVGEQYERNLTQPEREICEGLTRYFMANTKRLDYAGNLKKGLAIGSGVVEARGARWNLKNARAMAGMISVRQGPEWTAYWCSAA